MILFKTLFRRYSLYAYIFIPLEVLLLFNKLSLISMVLNIFFISFISYSVFKQTDSFRKDMVFFASIGLRVILLKYLFLIIFTALILLPYFAIFGIKTLFLFFDYLSLFLIFVILGNMFARKIILLSLFLVFLFLDIFYHLAYTCFTQPDIFYSFALLSSHSILLFLLLKQYRVRVWKHLII